VDEDVKPLMNTLEGQPFFVEYGLGDRDAMLSIPFARFDQARLR